MVVTHRLHVRKARSEFGQFKNSQWKRTDGHDRIYYTTRRCYDGELSFESVADYPLGRIGSCLRPGMVRGPGPFKEKREKMFY